MRQRQTKYLNKAFLLLVEVGPVVDDLPPDGKQIIGAALAGSVAIADLIELINGHADDGVLRGVRRASRVGGRRRRLNGVQRLLIRFQKSSSRGEEREGEFSDHSSGLKMLTIAVARAR